MTVTTVGGDGMPTGFGKGFTWDRSQDEALLVLFINAADPLGISIDGLQAGDQDAARPLWQRYHARLIELARANGASADPRIRQRLAGCYAQVEIMRYLGMRTLTKFLAGGMAEDEFIKFRLKQGVYGQRQPDVQMIRVKLPFGGITPEQMEAFADVIEQYVPLGARIVIAVMTMFILKI